MSRIKTLVFSVPRWEAVKRHEEHDQVWPDEPPPNLATPTEEARIVDQILCAYIEDEDDPGQHPYAIGGAVDLYYAWQGAPGWEETEITGFGRVKRRYGFSSDRPDTLDHYYEYDRDDMDFEMLVTSEGHYAIAMHSGNMKHLLAVNLPGDTFEAIMIRASVVVQVLDGLDGIYSSALPLYKDTVPIAHQRIAHVLRWQFENSRTQPLFA